MTLRRRAAHFGAVLLSWPVERYITAQRDRLASAGVAIAPALTEEFRGWFSTDLLESVRIVASGGLHLPAVPFESILRRFGMDMPGAQLAAAMTFDNVVAVREDHPPARLLFHELVHVAQYRLLGNAAFARLYVRGFLTEGSYDRIPLERCAWALEDRFATRRHAFSVEQAVSSWAERDLF